MLALLAVLSATQRSEDDVRNGFSIVIMVPSRQMPLWYVSHRCCLCRGAFKGLLAHGIGATGWIRSIPGDWGQAEVRAYPLP